MSNVYSTEPQTTAQVVFDTTHGPLNIHLWAKECPHTVRYFLQLCLDGYYNNLPFNRIIPGFMIQTGDAQFRQAPSSSSLPAASASPDDGPTLDPTFLLPPKDDYKKRHGAHEALDRRRYELNSRIRFNHRGQIAMAMTVDDTDNDVLQPQWFVTLEDSGHLDGQHVIFGTLVGPSIFNAIRMGKTDVDEATNQPSSIEEAPRILKTKVQSVDGVPDTLPALIQTPEPPLLPWHVNPFLESAGRGTDPKRKKKKERKGVKNINLLSFGEEMGEADGDMDGLKLKESSKKNKKNDKEKKKSQKVQSSHEAPSSSSSSSKSCKKGDDSGRLVNKVDEELDGRLKKNDNDHTVEEEADDAKSKNDTPPKNSEEDAIEPSKEKADTSMGVTKDDSHKIVYQPTRNPGQSTSGSGDGRLSEPPRAIVQSESKSSCATKKKKISLVEARRAKYAASKAGKVTQNKQLKEEETMKKLMAFRQKVAAATAGTTIGTDMDEGKEKHDKKKKRKRHNDEDEDDSLQGRRDIDDNNQGYHGQITEDSTYDANRDNDWMTTKFKCRRHMDHDARMGGDGRAANDYKVVEEKHMATDRKQNRRKNHHHRHR